jgi:glycine/D-amino acid oxidase-like deaminating enzyme
MSSFPNGLPTLNVDVVIIGGGIQGLWLLSDLVEAGYQTILLERKRPGFGQTGHSHVFLHEGHIYASMLQETPQDTQSRVAAVLKANALWKAALKGGGRLQNLTSLQSNFYIGWSDPGKAWTFEERCELTNLPYQEVEPDPLEFAKSAKITNLYKSEGISLESSVLLDRLMSFSNEGKLVGCCQKLSVQANETGGFDLLAEHDRDLAVNQEKEPSLQIRARSLVLSAGAGNETVINSLFGSATTNATRQQTVKTFMLVLRHKQDSLPWLAGMFPDFGGIFFVSRKDSQGRTVWLIGDKQRELVAVPGDMTTFDAITWFEKLKRAMEKLFPDTTANADNYEWGIYEATKAEHLTKNKRFTSGGAFPESYHVHKDPAKPLWLVWPTLLTFAPLVARSIVADLTKSVSLGSPKADWNLWDRFRSSLPPGDCRWKKTPLQSWEKFSECFTTL